jgi:hypothetical protein
MTFSAAGAASDAAQLWQFGVYVLDVMDQNGLMVPLPLDALDQKEGPPQMSDESRRKALLAEIAKVRAAGPQPPPSKPDPRDPVRDHHAPLMPAYAYVAFDTTPEKEDEAEREAIERRRQQAQRPVDPAYGVPRPVDPGFGVPPPHGHGETLPHDPHAEHKGDWPRE